MAFPYNSTWNACSGRARPEHAQQVELYKVAVAAMHPGVDVDAQLIYLEEAIN